MRVPSNRSSRSNTATTATTTAGGKRLPLSTASSAASSGKKRKLQSDTSSNVKSTHKPSSSGDASSSNTKRKQTVPNVRKHAKKVDVGTSAKTVAPKKQLPKKTNGVSMVGIKKIKIKGGKVTVKKILMTTTAKSQRKIKTTIKQTSTKKQVNTSNKKGPGSSTAGESSTQQSNEPSSGGASGKNSSEEDQQKKTQCKTPVSSKLNTKKLKHTLKTTKIPSVRVVSSPVTRTKKLQKGQKLKAVKKICLKKYPATRHIMVTKFKKQIPNPGAKGKKKITTRRKQTVVESGGGSGDGNNTATSHKEAELSGNSRQKELSGASESIEPGSHVISVTLQSTEKSASKGSGKKAKDGDSAIKKTIKKKVIKKKPKMEVAVKESAAGKEEAPGETISESTKDKTEAPALPPKKEGKTDNKDGVSKLKKKQKLRQSEVPQSKEKPTKKASILKAPKVVSTKLKKMKTSNVSSNSKSQKKSQQMKKKLAKPVAKKVVIKDPNSEDSQQTEKKEQIRKPSKSGENNDEDSSTSDEVTLDVFLLRQKHMKKENIGSDEVSKQSEMSSEPSSPVVVGKHTSHDCKPSLPLIAAVKLEDTVSNTAAASALSPATVITSDDEDLKSIKNRIKVKLEDSQTDSDERQTQNLTDKGGKKKAQQSKSKYDDNSASRGKNVSTHVKKEPKDETEKQKSDSESKGSQTKEKVKKVISVKKRQTGVKRSRTDGGKSGGSGSDTEQRARRMKLFGFWSGPKRHRVASLNALAKVHCLYENESRGAMLGICSSGGGGGHSQKTIKRASTSNVNTEFKTTRTLRSAPGLRGMGKHWDMHNASSTSSSSPSSSSSDDNDSNSDSALSPPSVPPASSCSSSSSKIKQKQKQQKITSSAANKKTTPIKNMKKVIKRRRNRCELVMDLKDMVVRKRMASLNASAILAASYSIEKRQARSVKEDTTTSTTTTTGDDNSASSSVHQVKKKKKKRLITKKIVEVEDDSSSSMSTDVEVEECDLEGRGSSRSVIEVRTTPSGGPNSNKKVAVIVNQDTDVTITGVYVNSTTRSTHHEGFCSIAGMQYRISSTSHTQTEATAVATETVLHTTTAAEHPPPQHHPAEPPLAPPMKSYTPLGALSNMQPPGTNVVGGPPPPHHHHHPHPHPHPHPPPPCAVPPQQPPPHRVVPPSPGTGPAHPPISPLGRRHGCSSAFSAPPPPPTAAYGPPPQHPQPPPPPPPHHHPPHPPPPQGQQDPAYIHGYYQPAGPLISTHHHHHSSSSSSSSSITNTGKLPPAVLPTLDASPNPTPPPSAAGHSAPPTSAPPAPQQIVSATSSSGGGGARSGGDESDSDVIITATSCSGSGEVAPPPPVPQPLPHQAAYRYPQSYPPPPTPSTPQHIHPQSYSYNYPHTQYYPSPPASASIQYSAVATNPPSLQQHHSHYHNQDLCYSSSANYSPAAYFHHKSYSTPPPASYHRRYIPTHHPAQYYTSELYSSPAANASQQNSGQSQQSQQMVVTGSSTGSASSYQPPAAPPPPSLVGVSSNPPPPPLVDSYPPPVSIVDAYPPPPGYYPGYSTGPGAAGCYTHSPPTRSLAFIDAAYQSCPCPMQSCPKNVHTGPLTGDGKGPHIASKQQQPPVQESGATFHQLTLPPVALALPLEPPGALGPPSPARGSAGMPPPPSPATASARNPNHTQEEAAFQQRGWDMDTGSKESQSSKQESSVMSKLEATESLQSKPDSDTTITSDESKMDLTRHRLLAISKVTHPDVIVCRTKTKKKLPPAVNNVPLLMCDLEFQKKRQASSEIVSAKPEEPLIVDPKMVKNSVKSEVRTLEKEVFLENAKSGGLVQNGSKTIFRNGSARKRKVQPVNNVTMKTEVEGTAPKRRKLSTSSIDSNRLSPDCEKKVIMEKEDQINGEVQTKCKGTQKSQPLSSNSCSLHNAKQVVRKRKLDDAKDLAENKEPLSVMGRKKGVKVQRLQSKTYPSRLKQVKKAVISKEQMKRIDEVLDSVVEKSGRICEPLEPMKRNNSVITPVNKKTAVNKSVERKKTEIKLNGIHPQQKKPSLRHQTVKQEQDPTNCLNSNVSKIRLPQTNANHVRVDAKKTQQKKKSEETFTSGKTGRVSHMLRSHGLRDSLSDQSSDDTESNVSKGKAPCPPQNHSSATAVRRTSTGSRKEQSIATTSHPVKKQQPQQDMTVVPMTAVSRKAVLKRSLQLPKWSNGWKFEGCPFDSKVFLSSDDMLVTRKCYPSMRHEEGDVIYPRDCILLKSGPRKTDLPFVAKVAALWENPDDGEMMVSLLWYYRPEHTDHGRKDDDMEDEIFASKHKDINSVACIEDKCYVLTFNEYCRYRKGVRRSEDGVREPCLVVPHHEEYPRENRQPPGCVAPELVFFCRRVYDFRQRRILKNPG